MECQHVPANVSSAASFESLFMAAFCLSLKAENGQNRTFAIDRYLLRNSRSNYKSVFLYQRRISKWVF